LRWTKIQEKTVNASGSIACIILGLDLDLLSKLENFSAVILWSKVNDVRKARKALANRKGNIIPIVTDISSLDHLKIERHVCIDTTAAGGNVELLVNSN
jgi:RHH-type proline utilization regulon transcriptional repressor/proline dehydrogenase/delta 1-pyrroline-5-carboxylate dehydrogenase